MEDVAHLPSVSFRVKPLVATRPKDLLPVVVKSVVEPKEERDPDMLPRMFVPVKDRKAAVTFYKEGFGVHEVRRIYKRNPCIPFSSMVDNFFAELDFGRLVLVIHEGPFKPNTLGVRAFQTWITPKPREFVARAVSAGAVAEQFFRGKFGPVCRIKDPLDFLWQISTDDREPLKYGPFLPNNNWKA